LLWNRWRPADQPVRFWPLLLCAYIGTLSHPAFDWLNSYGIRLLEPFSSTWYAGDTLFIVDVWIWTTLIGCWVWSRRREKRGGDWQRPAWLGFAAIGAYIFANGLISRHAEGSTTAMLWSRDVQPTLVVANPVPLTFWRRTMLWRDAVSFGSMPYDLGTLPSYWRAQALGLDDPALAAARGSPDVEAFLFWSRMPIVIQRDGVTYLADQRFNSELTRGQFLIPLTSRP
jgi:inner membrane protein